MIQNAVVKRIVSPGVAEVSLMRQMECGLSCKSCDGCAQKPKDELLALADNQVGAARGNIVEVESNVGSAARISMLIFVLPCVALLLGYMAAQALGLPEGLCVLAGFAGLAAGFIPALLLNRAVARGKTPEFTIRSIRR